MAATQPHIGQDSGTPVKLAGDAISNRAFWIVLAFIEIIIFVVHLNALRTPHIEGDEVVFTFLSERLRDSPLRYNVQGELSGDAAQRYLHDAWQPMLGDLSHVESITLMQSPPDAQGQTRPLYDPAIYDRQIFFHPPLYPYSLTIMRTILGSDGGPLLSMLMHGLSVMFLALLGRMLINEKVGLIAAGLLAIESVTWVCGERLWIDMTLQAAVSGAALAAVWSAQGGGMWRFAVAGAILGLAGLTKLPAGLLAPAVLALWLLAPRRPKFAEMLIYVAAAAALVLPWMILTKVKYGAFLPSERPSEWLMEIYPRVRRTVERPASYSIVGLILVSPIFLYCITGWLRMRRELWIATTWAASFFIALTIIGLTGMGFQLRYLAPAIPALCLIAASGIATMRWWWWIPALTLAIYTWNCGIHTALLPGTVDPVPVALSEYLLNIFNWNLAEWFRGMW